MSAQNKRSSMTLYVNSNDPFCHRVRMILAEKDINADIIDVEKENKLEELYELNPYGGVPTLMTKDLIVYEPSIIFEYLEERFPYPPLLSVFPLERAQARMLCKKIDTEWMPLLVNALNADDENIKQANKIALLKTLFSLIHTLNRQPYLLGEEFTIVDCSMAIILYNLPKLDVRLPEKAMPLIKYAKRLFERESFRKSIRHERRE
ncbi:glutathione S-transferase N-terminal domain-containing protein [Fastidiosibacter lacustris]|uniref:glutathione S-transferase N-terminal domain-containing protein n=1 Tax=Fastidiosibacter lacustris TaxID=2056695 RepID=UPI000E350398|nr:glutathione S-transferase N-terminal domain-containing protein [Fastidiosibacter lacustris]